MFFRLLSPTVATLELICTTFEERSIRIIQTLLLGLFVERFQGGKQLIELLGGKAGEVVEVLGLAAEFLNGKHSSRSLPLPPQLRNGFISHSFYLSVDFICTCYSSRCDVVHT